MMYSYLICIVNVGDVELKAISSVVDSCEIAQKSSISSEIIIVLNGKQSIENEKILKKTFQNAEIRIIVSPIRQLTSSLNIGLINAAGEYIVRFDGDDICQPQRLVRIQSLVVKNNYPDIIAGSAKYTNGSGVKGVKPKDLSSVTRLRSPFIHPALTIKKEYLINIGGYMGFQYAQDFELAIRAYNNGCRYVIDPEYHIQYNLSESQTKKKIKSMSMQLSYSFQDLLIDFRFKYFTYFIAKLSYFYFLKLKLLVGAKI